MRSPLYVWVSSHWLILCVLPELLLANEVCITDEPTQRGPSLLQEIPWRYTQRNLSATPIHQEPTEGTSQRAEPRSLASWGSKVSNLSLEKHFRLTHAVLLALWHWDPHAIFVVAGLIIIFVCLGGGFLLYSLCVFLWGKQHDAGDHEPEIVGAKRSSFTAGFFEGLFTKKPVVSAPSIRTAPSEGLLLSSETQSLDRSRTQIYTLAMEKDLVNIVANAHYDVTRYPGHVVCITSDSSGDRHGFLEQEIHARTHSKLRWAFMYLLAVAVTCILPLVAVFGKTPTECAVIQTVSKLAGPELQASKALKEEQFWLCNVHKGHMQPVLVAIATSAGYVGPLMCLICAILLHISILTGTHRNWIFSWYTRTMCWVFAQFSKFMAPVLFNYVNKPENSNMTSIVFVWKWMSYTPYMIIYWWLTTMALFVTGAIAMHELEWGGILILFVGRLYLPLMSLILGANDRLSQVIISALQNTYFPCADDESTPHALRAMSLSSTGIVKTDVWYRLFQSKGKCFACSTHEFDLLLRYLEDSHNGTKQGGKRWPIWWHDDVAVTGNNVLTEVFLEDIEVVITNSDRASYSIGRKRRLTQGHSVEDGNLDSGAEEMLMGFHKRIQELRWSAPQAK